MRKEQLVIPLIDTSMKPLHRHEDKWKKNSAQAHDKSFQFLVTSDPDTHLGYKSKIFLETGLSIKNVHSSTRTRGYQSKLWSPETFYMTALLLYETLGKHNEAVFGMAAVPATSNTHFEVQEERTFW